VWQREHALQHPDLGEPLFDCVDNHGRRPHQPGPANEDPAGVAAYRQLISPVCATA